MAVVMPRISASDVPLFFFAILLGREEFKAALKLQLPYCNVLV
jgi:hypothetical protein